MQETVHYLNREELEQALEYIRQSPQQEGKLELIVRRPSENEREVLEVAELSTEEGLVGDTWRVRGSSRTEDGSPHPDMQLNIMNARMIEKIAITNDRWKLAGDQLFVDMDLSYSNLPPGTQLEIGEAIIEVTNQPHLGCKKFVSRFGLPAMQFVNSAEGRKYNLRGINARVIQPGRINTGDVLRKL